MVNLESEQATEQTPISSARPACDEWGLYDPEQAGFEAIVRRLLPDQNDDARTMASSLPVSNAASAR